MSKIAVVVGGAGNVGSAVVTALLELGDYKKVAILSRSQEKIDIVKNAIREKVGSSVDKIVGIVINISDSADSVSLKKKLAEAACDKIDHVVSAAGFSFLNFGPLVDATFDQLQDAFNATFFSTFGAYKQLMPLVKNNPCGSYLFVTGGGPDMYLGPGTAGMTIAGSVNTALAKVVPKEHFADNVTCTEISFLCGVCPDPSVMGPGFTWLASAEVGKALASVVSKRNARGKTITVTNASDIHRLISDGV